MRAGVGRLLRRLVPARLKTVVPVRTRARLRAWAGLDVFPDLAVRHALFRSPAYRALRHAARGYDEQKRGKPIMERPHQASFLVARWLAAAGTRSAFHVGYASGRYLFYLGRVGIVAGGTDLPGTETYWTERVAARLEPGVAPRLLTRDFFDLRASDIHAAWGAGNAAIDVCFSEATFETLLPWREGRVSVPKYGEMDADALRDLMLARFPEKVAELAVCFRNFAFIEPEPGAGGAGAVFDACARRLPDLEYGVWSFRRPFDQLFRLTPRSPVRQVVYTYTRDRGLVDALAPYAERVGSLSASPA
jgi:hypothetical protein